MNPQAPVSRVFSSPLSDEQPSRVPLEGRAPERPSEAERAKSPAMTSKGVTALLKAHYLPESRPPGGLFLPEIASPCGRRRADLIWIPTSLGGAAGGRIVGHEIKVTRSDVIAELSDPTKPDPWLKHCSRWWLVVSDPALIDGLTIPDLWGVMAPPSGRRTRSMTILRDAPRLTPTADATPVVTRIAAYTVNRLDAALLTAKQDADRADRESARLRAQIEDLRVSREFGTSPHARRVNGILSAVSKRCRGTGWWVRDASDEDVIEAIVDLTVTRGIERDLRSSIDRVLDALSQDPARSARERLQEISATLTRTEGAS